MRRVAAALLLVAGLLAAPRAHAIDLRLFGEPLRLDVTESLQLGWRGDPGNGDASSAYYGEGYSRLNLQAAWRDWLFAVRLDSSGYVSAPEVGETLAKPNAAPGAIAPPVIARRLENRFQQHLFDPYKGIEKITLRYQGRALEATLGDFYASFGRGLVLSVRKVDELGQDTTILGAKVTYRHRLFTGTALAGVANTQNIDEATARYTPDPLDKLAAARVEARLWDKVNIGAQGMVGFPAKNASLTAESPDRIVRGGFSIDAPRPLPWLSLFAEYARREDRVTDEAASGDALYAAATVFTGKLTWLFEGKHYTRYETWKSSNDTFGALAYMQPPTLERIIVPLTNNSDITAGRLKVDFAPTPTTLAYIAAEYGRFSPNSQLRHQVVDLYAGAQERWSGGRGHFFPLVGLREERDVDTGHLAERIAMFEGDLAQPIVGDWSLESQWLIWHRSKEGVPEWREGQLYVAIKSAPKLVVAGGYEFTTLSTELANQHHFFNGTVQWNITPATSLRLFLGGQRPGLKCISGLCRVFPAFNGAKVELVIRG